MPLPWKVFLTSGRFVQKRTDVAIVCFASGSYYEYCTQELVRRFEIHNPEINVFVFKDFKSIGSPSHSDNPYAFKYFAIEKVRSIGYTTVIWCDSILKLQKSITPLIQEVQDAGIYLQNDSHLKSGTWANDTCLAYFGVTRDEAMEIPCIWACFMGFNFAKPQTHEFMRRWKAALDAGVFRGKHTNEKHTESNDPRCQGHRHDQSAAELIAHQMKLTLSKRCVNPNPSIEHTYFVGRPY